jgi:ATP-dependent exoDNAse (exonuclease V) alpha subunit
MIAKVLVKWGCTLKLCRQSTLPIDLPLDQLEALRTALGSRAAIITGGAGTGKTTLVNYMLEQSELKWYLLAPTHRAVANMRAKIEQSHERAYRIKSIQTLESFLVAHENPYSKKSKTYDNFGFVVDEASMIDSFQMARLLDAIHDAGRLVLVGDANQLPSIGPGRVLEDLTKFRALPTGLLTTIRRSGVGSTITVLAGEIALGRLPGKRIGGEVRFIPCSEGNLVEVVTRIFFAKDGHLTKDVQIISPYNVLNNDINKSIRQVIHGRVENDFSPGDRLICMKTLSTKDRPSIHNGEFATFIRAGKSGAMIKVDDGTTCEIYLSWEKLKFFRLGWATTVHKAQGTEWPHIIVVVPKGDNSEFVDRSLIYTAITRAQSNLIVIGDSQAVIHAVKYRSVDRRETLLGAFVMEALQKTHF